MSTAPQRASPHDVAAAGSSSSRCMAFGAEPVDGGSHVRVYARKCQRVDVVVGEDAGERGATAPDVDRHATRAVELAAEGDGWFSGFVAGLVDGGAYAFRLDGDDKLYPDPASRSQPDGPHGRSRVVDPTRFAWSDGAWRGGSLPGQVIYEMHIGTLTPEGTWAAATAVLPELAALGVTVVEVVPVAEFPGDFGWGYDGVCLYAPSHLYGSPDDFRRFVDHAHRLGVGVILDVVYNHFGPDGNYLRCFADDWFSTTYKNEWGEPLNFDGPHSEPTRLLMMENAAYWVREFHLDGLRLDATQQIYDTSPEHLVAAVTRRAREAAGDKPIIVVTENETQSARLVRPVADGGHGVDGVWNDDLHHAAVVALTGRAEAYFSDHRGRPQEFISAAKRGYLFQGQHYAWQKNRRGEPCLGAEPWRFIAFQENHDQVANGAAGRRLHELTSPARKRAMTTLLLLGPWTPMLFQGEEHDAPQPFVYFAHHKPDLAMLVKTGRNDFLGQFPSLKTSTARERNADPAARESFTMCKLDPADRRRNKTTTTLVRDLLGLRRDDPTLRLQGSAGLDGAVLGPWSFVLRFFGAATRDGGPAEDRLLIVNLGPDDGVGRRPEPLLAPPWGKRWQLELSSEDPRYGGHGVAEFVDDAPWLLPANTALLLTTVDEERQISKGQP